MRNREARLVFSLVVCVGCATVVDKTPVATSGSKADGIVEMSFVHTDLEIPRVDWEEAGKEASERCESWGYKGAEPFSGEISLCQANNQYGCLQYLVTAHFQCVDE